MSVKSAVRVLKIFELLVEYPDGLSMREISERLSLPQSSAFHLIKTLHERRYISVTNQKIYKLGPKLIQIGTKALENLDLTTEAEPHLRRLMENVEETVFMAVLLDQELVYVAKVDNRRSVRTSAQIGARKPLYCTGLGKTFLANVTEHVRDQLLVNEELTAITNKTITDVETLKDQLNQFKAQGYSIDDEENEEGLYCLAAPVFNVEGNIIAAISVAGPKERIYPRKKTITEKLLHTSKAISESIGY
ncbi:IclR family transcriptional regulator [Pseudalkalibacillus hwajinpoensis]|uniref:IclR family transcriptional regulator n=1 Tax=Guptibacillus hwajinpoensis TaxID=208199 RepID=UPI00325B3C3B